MKTKVFALLVQESERDRDNYLVDPHGWWPDGNGSAFHGHFMLINTLWVSYLFALGILVKTAMFKTLNQSSYSQVPTILTQTQ